MNIIITMETPDKIVADKSGQYGFDTANSISSDEESSTEDICENNNLTNHEDEDEEEKKLIDNIQKEFIEFSEKYAANALKELENANNSDHKIRLRKKYPMLKRVKKNEFLNKLQIEPFEKGMQIFLKKHPKYAEKTIFRQQTPHKAMSPADCLRDRLRAKIHLLKKHAQNEKTKLDILKIIHDINDTFAIVMCKNSLLANSQFISRFIKMFEIWLEKMGQSKKKMKDYVLVLRSSPIKKKSELHGRITWCKNRAEVWYQITTKETFKIIFNCSNNTRITDMDWFIRQCEKTTIHWLKDKKTIHVDEAHDTMTGIPAFRPNYERILLSPLVHECIPVSASEGVLYGLGGRDGIWDKETMSTSRFKYRKTFRKKSDDPHYSSVADATKCYIDDWNLPHKWCTGEKYLDKVWKQSGTPGDQQKKGLLIKNALCGDEAKCLNFIEELIQNKNTLPDGEKLFRKGQDIHLVLAPNRTLCTRQIQRLLCKINIKDGESPLVISLYRSYFRPRWIQENGRAKNSKIVKLSDNRGQFNDDLANWLKEHPDLSKRQIIIVGNRLMVGESLTFVHARTYGYVRSVIIPPGKQHTQAIAYQFIARQCFILNHFLEIDKEFTKKNITKYIVAEKKNIDSAINWEKTNDDWCVTMDIIPDTPQDNSQCDTNKMLQKLNDNHRTNNIPILGTWRPHRAPDLWKEYRTILEKKRTTSKDKIKLSKILIAAEDKGAITIINKNADNIPLKELLGGDTINAQKLQEIRRYRDGDKIENRRFRQYKNCHDMGSPYSHSGNLEQGKCAIDATLVDYHDKDGNVCCREEEFYITQRL